MTLLKWLTRLLLWPMMVLLALGYGSHWVVESKRAEMADEAAVEFGARQGALAKRVEAEVKALPAAQWRFRLPAGERVAHGTGLAVWMESAVPDLRLLMLGYDYEPVRLLRAHDASVGTFNSYSGLGKEFMVQGGTLVPLDAEHVLFSGGHRFFERFDSQVGTHNVWQVGPFHTSRQIPMQLHRAYHAAVKAPGGTILILGGEVPLAPADESQRVEFLPTDAVERVDLVQGVSTLGSPLLQARSRFSMATLPDGKLLLSGGLGSRGLRAAPLAHTEIYDLATGLSTAAPSLRHARHSHATLQLSDGAVLVAGGLRYDAQSDRQERLDSAELWQDGTWHAVPSLHFPRLHPALVELEDGRVLVMGGGSSYVESWERGADRWRIEGWDSAGTTLALPIDEERLAALSPAYLPMYLDPQAKLSNYHSRASAEITRVERVRGTLSGQLSLGRVQGSVVELPGGRLLVSGGHMPVMLPEDPVHRDRVLNHVELYDVKSEKSVRAGQLATRRFGHQSFTLPDGRAVVLGGRAQQDKDGFEPVLSLEVIDPATLAVDTSEAIESVVERAYRAIQEPGGDLLLVEQAEDGARAAGAYRWHWRDDRVEALAPLPGIGRPLEMVMLAPDRVLVLGSKAGGDTIDTAVLWDPVARTSTPLPAPPRGVTPVHMVAEPELGYVGIVGKESVLVWDAVAGAWRDHTEFFKALSEEPGSFAPPVVAHIGRGQLLCSNVVPPNPHLGYQGGRPGIVDLFAGKSMGEAYFDAPSTDVPALRHSNGRLYYVGHRSGHTQHGNMMDVYAGVVWFAPPAPRAPVAGWFRRLQVWWALHAGLS